MNSNNQINTFEAATRKLVKAGNLCQTFGITHGIFRLNEFIFEYTPNGVIISEMNSESTVINWEYFGNQFKGITTFNPDDLKEEIEKSGEWTADKYNVYNHNSHDFMLFCYNLVSGSKVSKKLICVGENKVNPIKRIGCFFSGIVEVVSNIF